MELRELKLSACLWRDTWIPGASWHEQKTLEKLWNWSNQVWEKALVRQLAKNGGLIENLCEEQQKPCSCPDQEHAACTALPQQKEADASFSAAAAAESLQSCPTLCDPIVQPTRMPCPWDSPGKNTGVGCHFLLQCMKVKSESEVAQLCRTLSDPMDCSPPGSSVYGIFQARVLEWGAIAFSVPSLETLNHSCQTQGHQARQAWRVKTQLITFYWTVKVCLLLSWTIWSNWYST